MIGSLIQLVIYFVILGVLLYLVDVANVPMPFNRVIKIIIYLVGAIVLIYFLLGLADNAPHFRLR